MIGSRTAAWLKSTLLIGMLSVAGTTAAAAQTTATERTLVPDASVMLDWADQQSTPTTIRKSDSLLNGALIGAGIGVATELFLCTRMEPWEICRGDVGGMLKFGAIGAAIGVGVDAIIRGRATIYQTPDGTKRLQAAPLIGRKTKGLQLSLTF